MVIGQQLGRQLGFHTANLQVPPDKLLPRLGVYCGWVHLDGSRLPAVMNIGYRPTIEGKTISVEIHLLDWSGNVYDRILTMDLVQFLRPEQKFNSLESIKKSNRDRLESLSVNSNFCNRQLLIFLVFSFHFTHRFQ
jgi:riboflavin kinase/FMN adenylyltransferase